MVDTRPGTNTISLPRRWPGIVAITVGLLVLFAVPAALRIGPPVSPPAAVLAVLGIMMFLAVAPDLPRPAAGAVPHSLTSLSRRRQVGMWALLALSVLLWVQAVRWGVGPAENASLARFGGGCWLVSIALYIVALLVRYAQPRPLRLPAWERLPRLELVLISVLTVLAFALRIVDVTEVPYPFKGDEGYIGVEAMRLVQGESQAFFQAGWAGQPQLSFVPAALFVALLGPEVLAVRLPSVLMGTAAVPLLYLLGRRLFAPLVGLLAAAILATWHYTIHFSRLGVSNTADVVLAVLVFWLLDRAVESDEPLDYLVAGLATGLTWYAYAGTRLVFLLALLYLAFVVVRQPEAVARRWPGLLIFVGAATMVAGPQILFYKDHLDIALERTNQASIVQTGWLANEAARRDVHPLLIVLEQFLTTVFVYIVVQPSDVSYYVAHRPLLDGALAALLVLGIAYSMLRLRDRRYFLLASWFWAVIVLGGTMTLQPPMVARLVLAAPAVCLSTALALVVLIATLRERVRISQTLVVAVAVGVVAITSILSVRFYFDEFTSRHYFGDPDTELGQVIGKYLGGLDVQAAYLAGTPRLSITFPSIPFLAPRVRGEDLATPLSSESMPVVPAGTRAVFLAIPERRSELELVQARYPGGRWREFGSRTEPRPLLYAYEVEGPGLTR